MPTVLPRGDVLGDLGSDVLPPPEASSRALEANDRLEYRLDLLALADFSRARIGGSAPRALQLLLLVAQSFERSADALAHAALTLRDHVLEEVTSR